MWRAFFFAIGTVLILLGLECLVTEQFVIADAAFVSQVLEGDQKAQGAESSVAMQTGASSGIGSRLGGSRFGPSRFDRSPFDVRNQANSNYYGGVPGSNVPNPNSRFSLAGFGTQRQPSMASMPQPRAATRSNRSTRNIRPKEWMPWSFLAAGTLVVLYTNSLSGRFGND